MLDEFVLLKTKEIEEEVVVNLLENIVDKYFAIEDVASGDIQSYDSLKEATEDFDNIVDYPSLNKVFGWHTF